MTAKWLGLYESRVAKILITGKRVAKFFVCIFIELYDNNVYWCKKHVNIIQIYHTYMWINITAIYRETTTQSLYRRGLSGIDINHKLFK